MRRKTAKGNRDRQRAARRAEKARERRAEAVTSPVSESGETEARIVAEFARVVAPKEPMRIEAAQILLVAVAVVVPKAAAEVAVDPLAA